MDARKEPARQSQVNEQFDLLIQDISTLEKVALDLSARLEPVLRIEPEPKTEAQDEKAMVPLAQALRENAFRVRRAVSILASINSRLEL